MIDTITSDSGVKYDIVEITKWIYYGQCVLQKSSQSSEVKTSSVWDYGSDTDMVTDIICKHSWYQRWLWNSRFCVICWFQEESSTKSKSEKQDFWKMIEDIIDSYKESKLLHESHSSNMALWFLEDAKYWINQ